VTSVLIRAQARSDSGRGDVPVLRTWFASSTLFYRRTGPNGPEDRVGGAIKARQNGLSTDFSHLLAGACGGPACPPAEGVKPALDLRQPRWQEGSLPSSYKAVAKASLFTD